jgi:hypothetical protein
MWYPYIPEGGLIICASPGGTGKGLWACEVVACETTSDQWPETRDHGSGCKVLWYELEDPVDEALIPRLIAAKADMSRVEIFEHPNDLKALTRKKIEEEGVRLIILSPLLAFLDINNVNDIKEVYAALADLSDKIRGLHCTVIGLMHPNKKTDLEGIERILGSVGLPNYVRSVLVLRPEDATTVRQVHLKYNLSIKGRDLLFVKSNTKGEKSRGQYLKIEWAKAEKDINPDMAFAKVAKDETAWDWLRGFLSDRAWHKRDDIIVAAQRHAHTEDAVRKAKEQHTAEIDDTKYVNRKVYWRLK